MSTNGEKLRIEDLTDRHFEVARNLVHYVAKIQTVPANTLGYFPLSVILKGHWKGAAGLHAGLAAGLAAGLGDGLYDGLHAGLNAGLGDGLNAGLNASLHAGLGDGLAAGLGDGLNDGLRDGLQDGMAGSDLKLSYCGVWWSWWACRYLIARSWGVPLDDKKLALLHAYCVMCPIVGESNGKPVILPKPTKVRWNITGQTAEPFCFPIYELHGNGEPSVEYPGLHLYHWHNVKIPERMGRVNSEHWDPRWLADEGNAEVRRVLIRELGYDRVFAHLGGVLIDSWREYELTKLNLGEDINYLCLKMVCPSTGDVHMLRVPPDMDSAENAITWVNHGTHPDQFASQA